MLPHFVVFFLVGFFSGAAKEILAASLWPAAKYSSTLDSCTHITLPVWQLMNLTMSRSRDSSSQQIEAVGVGTEAEFDFGADCEHVVFPQVDLSAVDR